jgi:hypothetical protein
VSNPLVTLFATTVFTGTGSGITQDVLFAGADGTNAGVAAERLVPPPQSGIVRRVTLRTISMSDNAAAGTDYFARLFGTRINPAALEGNASMAASYIGTTLAPLTPTTAVLADLTRVDPDLDQVVEWPYNLQSPLVAGPGGDAGAVPATVPGLLARMNIGPFNAAIVIVVGIGIMVESLQPGFPAAPLFQRGGTSSGVPWPLNQTP